MLETHMQGFSDCDGESKIVHHLPNWKVKQEVFSFRKHLFRKRNNFAKSHTEYTTYIYSYTYFTYNSPLTDLCFPKIYYL